MDNVLKPEGMHLFVIHILHFIEWNCRHSYEV